MADVGRRERTTRERRERILRAARDLFEERGYDAATTSEIAERADISHATLFRYAATKSELLLMVGNEWFRSALDEGVRRSSAPGTAHDRVRALISPLVDGTHAFATIAAYQRHAVACSTDDAHAAAARTLVEELIAHIAGILRDGAADSDDDPTAVAAARAVYAVLHLAILEADLDATDLLPLLTPQLDIVIRGHHAAAAEERREL